MTRHLTPPPRPAVIPVVEYEPPAVGLAHSPAVPHRPHVSRPRSVRHLQLAPRVRERPAARAAAIFAEAALRRVLEVIDRRRPVAQLRPLLADGLLDAVIALSRSRHTAAAMLSRVRLRVVDRDGKAAEVFASYTRGDRVHAIAGRVELVDVRGVRRWRIVALQIG